MVLSGSSLRDLSIGMPRLPQTLVNVELDGAAPAEVMEDRRVREAVADVEAALGDSGRVLLRPSGTEPLIRVMVEGTEASRVTEFANAIADAVRTAVST
jgi:Phosphomannomutase